MKLQSFIVPFLAIALIVGGTLAVSPVITFAQDTSPVETPVPDVPVDPLPDDPIPIPPTLLGLLVQLIEEGAGWLTGMVLLGLGISQKWLVSFIRKLFPNNEKTATKINGGVAELVAGATSIATALIAFGVVWATGLVSSLDVVSLLELAGITYVSGFGTHKLNKLSSIAKALKASS